MRDWFREDWNTKDIKKRKLNPEDVSKVEKKKIWVFEFIYLNFF